LLGTVTEDRCKSKPPGPRDSCRAGLPVLATHRFAGDCSGTALRSGLGPVRGWGWYRPGRGLGREKVPGAALCPLQSGQSAGESEGPGPLLVRARAAAPPPAPLAFLRPAPWCQRLGVGFEGGLRATSPKRCFPCVG